MFNLPVKYSSLHFTQKRLVREQYIKEQKGLCWHCKNPLTGKPTDEVNSKRINRSLFPTGFFDYPVHLHHSHDTGLTIGVVHNVCNAVLWQYYGE